MQGNDWDITLSNSFETNSSAESFRGRDSMHEWDSSLESSFGTSFNNNQKSKKCNPIRPDEPECNRIFINLLDFIGNQQVNKPLGPPNSSPTKPSLYGPWQNGDNYYISIWNGVVWRHVQLYTTSLTSAFSGIYGGNGTIPVLEFNSEGLLIGVSSEPLTIDINSLPNSGAVPGTYGDVNLNTLKIPSLEVNEKGIIESITEKTVELSGSQDKTYIHEQSIASAEWNITHPLNKYPSVTIVDSAGSIIIGEVRYNSITSVTVLFGSPFSGQAFLN